MLFYEDFIKNINSNIEIKGKENFSLELKKALLWLGTGIPFFLAGILELFIGYHNNSTRDYIIGVIFLFLSIKHIKLYLNYKITLDFDKDLLISKDIENISLADISSCTLKEEVLGSGKKVQRILRVITINKNEIIIPLMMSNKLKFVSLLKSRLQEKFIIVK